VPWYRWVSARTGLEGKVVLCFMGLLILALGASWWLFASEGKAALDRMAEAQATEVGRSLALASELPLQRHDVAELARMSGDLMKSRGVLGVAFFDPAGNALSTASRDRELEKPAAVAQLFPNPRKDPAWIGKARQRSLPSLGRYVEFITPVTGVSAVHGTGPQTTLVGYVTVCVAQADTDERVRDVRLSMVLIGAIAVLVSLPAVYLVVHRIFFPIRQLVAAADKIAGGDLDARVAIHRPDVIGMLARSFNEMVKQVKRQKDDLREANARLEQANGQLEQANARLGQSNDRLGEANTKLAEANRDLEQKVRQRTVQLEAANKRLSSEIAEKEDFLRAVSHDLNAPLRNISGMATMLLMKHRDHFAEDVIHRLERIQKNVEVETDLIGELLELSRIKTRRQKIETVDLNAVLKELGDVFAQDLESRQIRLVVDAPLPALDCERARLRQVFQNLIDNAIKYMGEGSPAEGSEGLAGVKEIHVGCTVRADEAEFYVRDTGIGIETDDLDKLFRVFRRGKNSAAQGVPGKGVGLASVKSIVETYSGTIWVESHLGRGSTFRFTINGKHVSAPPAGGARAA
jgi:signal transduction histidine kinase